MMINLHSLEDTAQFASKVAKHICPPMCLALNGTLGTGKTQFSRDLAVALGIESQLVTSPTYVLHQLYHGEAFTVHHFDFYRLETIAQVWDLGIEELYEQHALVIIEWANKFAEALPEDRLTFDFSQPMNRDDHANANMQRLVQIHYGGPSSHKIYEAISNESV